MIDVKNSIGRIIYDPHTSIYYRIITNDVSWTTLRVLLPDKDGVYKIIHSFTINVARNFDLINPEETSILEDLDPLELYGEYFNNT